MLAVIALLSQEYVPPPDAVSVVELPWQRFVFPEMEAAGNGFTVTSDVVVLVHAPFETVTVYVVFDTGESVIVADVAPLFHQE